MKRPAWLDSLPDDERERAREEPVPEWTAPMLATLTHDPFSDPDWIFERKLDGVRCLVFRDGGAPRILSRNRKALDDTYPELVDALGRCGTTRLVADGEIVAFDGDVTSFSRLQRRSGIQDPQRARASDVPVFVYLFDVMHLDGWRTTELSLRTRKHLLKEALHFEDPVRYTQHRNEHGKRYLEQACRRGWEGIIAKDARAGYVHGRSRRWMKFKCGSRQELVITGFTEPAGSRKGFGALLLGYFEDGALHYAGKVGTGFDDELLVDLRRRLDRIERERSAIDTGWNGASADGVHWVEPRMVAEIGFTEWTRAGKLRHPRFLGLRTDKPAREVVRERSEPAR